MLAKPVSTSAEPHELELAVRKGDLAAVQMLQKSSGLGIDTRFGDKSRTLLILAADAGSPDLIQALLDSGCTLGALDTDGVDALMVASAQGSLSCVKKQLSAQASVSTICKNQRTSLMYACLGRHQAVTKVLLDAGSDPNVGKKADNPLLFACTNGLTGIVECLLQSKANPNVLSNNQSVLGLALQAGHYDCVQQLLQHKANCSSSKEPLLQYALEHNRNDIAKMLLQGKASIASNNNNSNCMVETNPLFLAMNSKMIDVALLLVMCKSDVNAVNRYNEPVILHAQQQRNSSLINTILEHKLFVTNIPQEQRGQVLVEACRQPVMRLLEKCLKMKNWVSIEHRKKEEALQVAIECSHVDVVRAQLQTGLLQRFNVEKVAFDSKHPVYVALFTKNPEILAILLTHEADIDIITADALNRALLHAVSRGHSEMVEVLVDLGAVCELDSMNRPLLFQSVQNGDLDIVRTLLAGGHVDPEARHEVLGSAVVYAAATCHEAILCALLDHGVNVGVTDAQGKTALRWAHDNLLSENVINRLHSLIDDDGHDDHKYAATTSSNCDNTPTTTPTSTHLNLLKTNQQLGELSIHSPAESPLQSPAVQTKSQRFELAERSPRLASMVLHQQNFSFTSPRISTIEEEEEDIDDDSEDQGLFDMNALTLHTHGMNNNNNNYNAEEEDEDLPPSYTTFLRLNSAAFPTCEDVQLDSAQTDYVEDNIDKIAVTISKMDMFNLNSIPFE